MSLTSYRAAPPRVISAFGFSRMSVLPAQSVRIVASAFGFAECPAFCVSKIATLTSVLREQNRVFPAYPSEAKRPLEGGPVVSAEPEFEEKMVFEILRRRLVASGG